MKIKMVEYEGDYVPKELCSIDAHGGVDDVVPCSGTCEQEECDTCIVTKVFNEYARLTNQIKILGTGTMNDLKNWNEVTKGLYRYAVGPNVAYEIHILHFVHGADILAALSSLYLVGDWVGAGKTYLDRECLVSERTVEYCLGKAVEDYKENMS